MNQKQRDAVVIGLLSVIAVLALVAATRTMPAPAMPQYDSLETEIRQVLEKCLMRQVEPTGSLFNPNRDNSLRFEFECGY